MIRSTGPSRRPGLEVHAGEEEADPVTGARATPIYHTSSYAFKSAEQAKKLYALEEEGHIYTRLSNPTSEVLEKRVAAIENGVGALAQSSGMSAILLAILNIAGAGDEIVSSNNLYGGTYTLFKNTMPNWKIKVNFVDTHDLKAYKEAINENTKAIYCESIGNPQHLKNHVGCCPGFCAACFVLSGLGVQDIQPSSEPKRP